MVVAIAVGRPGVDTLLVASQVALSIVLPFIIFPLLWLTSSKTVMSARKSRTIQMTESRHIASEQPTTNDSGPPTQEQDVEAADSELVSFANNKLVIAIGGIIFIIVVAANVYAIVSLAMGTGG